MQHDFYNSVSVFLPPPHHIPEASRKWGTPGLFHPLWASIPGALHFSLCNAGTPLCRKTKPCNKRKMTYERGTLQVPNEWPKPSNSLGSLPEDTSNYITKEEENSSPLDYILPLLFYYNALVVHNYPKLVLEYAMLSNSCASTVRMERNCICKCQPTSSISPHSNNTHSRFSNWSYIFFLNVVVR